MCVNDGLYCINLDNSGRHVNYLTTISEQKDHFSNVDNKNAYLRDTFRSVYAYHLTRVLLRLLIQVGSRSVALIEGI